MISDDDRKRTLDRIKKCLALSKSCEPNEAAAALRQAQKLMAKFDVSPEEVLGLEVSSTQVVTPEPYKRKIPDYLNRIINICQGSFDCQAIIEFKEVNGNLRMAVRYFGFNGKDQLAGYAHEVIWRQLLPAWNAYRKTNAWTNNVKGARMSFWVGWLREVRKQVQDFASPPEQGEILQRALTAHAGGTLQKGVANKQKLIGETYWAGVEAADGFSIHRPMNGSSDQRALSHNS